MSLRLVRLVIAAVLLAAVLPHTAVAGTGASEVVVMVQLSDGSWEPRTIDSDTPLAALAWSADPDVLRVEPVRRYIQFDHGNPPSDPAYPEQWHLSRTRVARTWKFGHGEGVTVAIVDSGVAAVSDLACHSYVSPYDFLTDTAGVPPDSNGHGTFVTAIVAECTDNGLRGAGSAPGPAIMPLRVLDASGETTTDLVYQALLWANDHGAQVVNLSLGFYCEVSYSQGCNDPAMDFAISELVSNGAVVVAASGNDGKGLLPYPANHPDVIAVGATGHDGTAASYSTYGTGLHLMAPVGDHDDPSGTDGVIHQGASGGLEIALGTSFAAPQVAAAYSILLSAGAVTTSLATSALLQSAQDIAPAGYDTRTGYGDLRIRHALAWGGLGITPPILDAGFHASGDFDGNGRTDLVTYDKRFGRWWVLDSTGAALSASQWTRYSTTVGWQTHLIGDFTGDGKDDLASFHPSNGTWWISRSTGTGFTTGLWADFTTATGWGPQLVGDFNGDGRDDIAQYHSSNGTWWISRSTGNGFTTTKWATFTTRTGWQTHLVGDFNGDGKDDLASFHPSNGTWWISRSTGSGFTTGLWADFATATGWTAQLVGDFDGDGKDDIAQFHPSNGTWWISRSTGTGFSTGLWADFTTAGGWGPQLVGDFDGDDRDDVAQYHSSNGTWWISRSTGTGFTTGLWADFTTATGWTAQLVADLNGDGKDDIASHHADGIWVVSLSTGSGLSSGTWFD